MIDKPLVRSLVAMLPNAARTRLQQLGQSDIAYRLATGAFWSTVSEIAARAVAMITSFVIARALGREVFGELGVIQSTVGMFGTLAGFGLGITATKYVAQLRESDPVRTGRVIGITTITSLATGSSLALLMFILAPWLATHTLAAPHLASALQASSLLLLIGAVNGAQSGAMWGFEGFRRAAVINAWSGIAAFPLMVIGAFGWGLNGAVGGLILSRGGGAVLTHRALQIEAARFRVPIAYTHIRGEWSLLGSYSLPALTSSLVVMSVYWVCNALLVNAADGYAQLGLFNAANQWFNMLIVLPGILGSAVLPVLAQAHAAARQHQSRRVLAYAMSMNAVILLPVVLIGSILSPHIMSGYGAEFIDGWPTLIIVLVTAAFAAIQTPIGHVIAAAERMWLGSLMNIGWGVVFVGLTWALRDQGAQGLATARLIAYVAHGVWTFSFAATVLRAPAQNDAASSSRLADASYTQP